MAGRGSLLPNGPKHKQAGAEGAPSGRVLMGRKHLWTNSTLSFVSSWCSISTIWQLGREGSWLAGRGPVGDESPLSSASAPLLALEGAVLLQQLPQSLSGEPLCN